MLYRWSEQLIRTQSKIYCPNVHNTRCRDAEYLGTRDDEQLARKPPLLEAKERMQTSFCFFETVQKNCFDPQKVENLNEQNDETNLRRRLNSVARQRQWIRYAQRLLGWGEGMWIISRFYNKCVRLPILIYHEWWNIIRPSHISHIYTSTEVSTEASSEILHILDKEKAQMPIPHTHTSQSVYGWSWRADSVPKINTSCTHTKVTRKARQCPPNDRVPHASHARTLDMGANRSESLPWWLTPIHGLFLKQIRRVALRTCSKKHGSQ